LVAVEPDSSADEDMHHHDSSEIFDTDSSDAGGDALITQVAQEEELPEETKVEEEK
jgi:hypothetical protein